MSTQYMLRKITKKSPFWLYCQCYQHQTDQMLLLGALSRFVLEFQE